MKQIHKMLAFLPLLSLAAGCTNSDPAVDTPTEKGDLHVMMSVFPSKAETVNSTSDEGSEAERAYDENHIYFATYDLPVSGSTYDGPYKTYLKDGSSLNDTGDDNVAAKFYDLSWGPSVAARLPIEKYENGFAVAFFSVPANVAAANFTVKDKKLNNDVNFTLKWPVNVTGTVEGNTEIATWAPNKDNGNHIPMAGIVEVSADYMKGYNKTVYTGESPFSLPNVQPMRAMGKVVIQDPDGLIAKAEMKTAVDGMLFPSANEWISSNPQKNPRMTAQRLKATQVLTAPNGTETVNGKTANTYTFYSYEYSFRTPNTASDEAADGEGRKLVKLTSDPAKLKDKDGNALVTYIYIAPYKDGQPDTSISVGDLMSKDNGSWQGLMRNRIYTYVIGTSSKFDLNITASVKAWEKNELDEEMTPVKNQ